jgi:hypothetical protein
MNRNSNAWALFVAGGVTIDNRGDARGIGRIPNFPPEPYLLVSTLLETDDGQLLPFTKSQ